MSFLKPFASTRTLRAAALTAALGAALVPVQAETLIGLTTGGALVTFDSATPAITTAPVTITGTATEHQSGRHRPSPEHGGAVRPWQ
jgi:hypothetical protein